MIKNYAITSTAAGYTAPALTNVAVTSILLCNYSASATTVTVYVMEATGTAADLNTTHKTVALAAYDSLTISFEGKTMILGPADSVKAIAANDSRVSMTLSLLVL